MTMATKTTVAMTMNAKQTGKSAHPTTLGVARVRTVLARRPAEIK